LGQGVGCAHDAQLFTVHANQTDLMDTDFTVDAVFFFGCDVKDS
jgi:hypothetical protein